MIENPLDFGCSQHAAEPGQPRAHRCLSYFPRRNVSWKQELHGSLSSAMSNKIRASIRSIRSCGRSKDTRNKALSEMLWNILFLGCFLLLIVLPTSYLFRCTLWGHVPACPSFRDGASPCPPLAPPQPAFHTSGGQIHHTASGSSSVRSCELKTALFWALVPQQSFEALTNPVLYYLCFWFHQKVKAVGRNALNFLAPLLDTHQHFPLCLLC